MPRAAYKFAFLLIGLICTSTCVAQQSCKVPDAYLGKWFAKEDSLGLEVTCDSIISTAGPYRYAYKLSIRNDAFVFMFSPDERVTLLLLDNTVLSLYCKFIDGSKMVGVPNIATKYKRL